MLYPLKFIPQPVPRVWGGTALRRYAKPVPDGQRIGESWDISDRDEAPSIVANGPLQGQSLRQVIETLGPDLLGSNVVPRGTGVPPVQVPSPRSDRQDACPTVRFPLLVKLLDARERLSLQVHPPAAVAARLGGEPKTEMWYVLEADPGAGVIAGLRPGVTKEAFAETLSRHDAGDDAPSPRAVSGPGEGESPAPTASFRFRSDSSPITNRKSKIENLIHRLPAFPGDTFFIPAGRLHAIEAGLVLIEIQQNSDTTYRVYDWDRLGLDGKPRPLHVAESLACIDFTDYAPAKQVPPVERRGVNDLWRLVECEQFHVHRLDLVSGWPDCADGTTFHILTGVSGEAGILTPDGRTESLRPGEFVLVPAALGPYSIVPVAESTRVLNTTVPPPRPGASPP